MKVKELKGIIANLSDEMEVTAIDSEGLIKNATAFVDSAGEDHEYQQEWLTIAVEVEEEE